jgi:two-component system nitrate/nitrite sensor histidine kinase NarX
MNAHVPHALTAQMMAAEQARAPVESDFPVSASASSASPPVSGLLADVAAGLATGDDLGEVLGRFLAPLVRLAGAQGGAVRVLSDSGAKLQLVSSFGVPEGVLTPGTEAHRHCGHCGHAADGQALVWASDLKPCAQRSGSDYFGQGCVRMLAVPLRYRGATLGVYNLFFDTEAEPPVAVQHILRTVGELLGLALNNARLEKQHLHAQLLQERQAMAADVHDSLGQSLAYVKMRLPLLSDAVQAGEQARAHDYLEDIRSTVSQAHGTVRSIISHLRTPVDPQGLAHALLGCVEQFRRASATPLDYANEWPGMRLPPERESQVFHIVQEALTNISRHASARQAWLHIKRRGLAGVLITIDDDGLGIPATQRARTQSQTAERQAEAPPDCGGHYGLQIMAERARRMQAQLQTEPRPGGGTRISLAFSTASWGERR